jgi:hypothetical protein
MNKAIEELEVGLKAQLASLTDEIRSAEESLLRTKEGYLKVKGALEIFEILKQKISTDADEALAKSLTNPLAE